MLKPEFVRLYELAVSAMHVHQGTQMYVDCFQEDGRGTVPEEKKCEREAFEVILREHKEGQREEIKKTRRTSKSENSLPQNAERSRTRCHMLKYLKYLHLAKEYMKSVFF